MTPQELQRKARQYDRLVDEAIAAGDVEAARRYNLQAELYRAVAREPGRASILSRLPFGDQSGNVTRKMVAAQRLRHSQGTGTERDELVQAANRAGFTLRSLGERVGVTHSLLSQARSGKKAIREDLAKQIETLTGFRATKKNWPKGWV